MVFYKSKLVQGWLGNASIDDWLYGWSYKILSWIYKSDLLLTSKGREIAKLSYENYELGVQVKETNEHIAKFGIEDRFVALTKDLDFWKREIGIRNKQIDGMAIQIAKLTPDIDTLQNSD